MEQRLRAANIKIFVGAIIAIAVVIGVIALVRLDTTGKKGSELGREFVYDIEGLAKIDPNLILYEESAQPISTGFTKSHSIAADSQGLVYVAGDKAIRIFAQGSGLVGEIKLADMPRCLAVTGDGNIYVGVKEHVEVYDRGGKQLAKLAGHK